MIYHAWKYYKVDELMGKIQFMEFSYAIESVNQFEKFEQERVDNLQLVYVTQINKYK